MYAQVAIVGYDELSEKVIMTNHFYINGVQLTRLVNVLSSNNLYNTPVKDINESSNQFRLYYERRYKNIVLDITIFELMPVDIYKREDYDRMSDAIEILDYLDGLVSLMINI